MPAWTWLKFVTADPEGTAIICGGGALPAYKKSNLYAEYRKDPLHAGFINVLESASHVRPIMPASDVLYAQLDNALTQVLAGKKSPIDALTLARADLQANCSDM